MKTASIVNVTIHQKVKAEATRRKCIIKLKELKVGWGGGGDWVVGVMGMKP